MSSLTEWLPSHKLVNESCGKQKPELPRGRRRAGNLLSPGVRGIGGGQPRATGAGSPREKEQGCVVPIPAPRASEVHAVDGTI